MATINKELIGYYGGKEEQMSGLATFFLVVGIIGCIACIIVAGSVTKTSSYSDWGEHGVSPVWVVLGLACLIHGIALFIVLRGGAEIIRLLKKQNGLQYAGKISEPFPEYVYKCPACGITVDSDAVKCFGCGEKFETG